MVGGKWSLLLHKPWRWYDIAQRSFSIRSFSGSALPILTFLPCYFALTRCSAAFSRLLPWNFLPHRRCSRRVLLCIITPIFFHFRQVPPELIHFYTTSGSGIQHTLTSRTYNFRNKSNLLWHISLRANIIYARSTLHARTTYRGECFR